MKGKTLLLAAVLLAWTKTSKRAPKKRSQIPIGGWTAAPAQSVPAAPRTPTRTNPKDPSRTNP